MSTRVGSSIANGRLGRGREIAWSIEEVGREDVNGVRTIELDGSDWVDDLAFLFALRTAVGAPDCHGMSINAFIDSMIWGGINSLDSPYTILVTGLERAPSDVVECVDYYCRMLAEADEEHLAEKGMLVNVKIVRR